MVRHKRLFPSTILIRWPKLHGLGWTSLVSIQFNDPRLLLHSDPRDPPDHQTLLRNLCPDLVLVPYSFSFLLQFVPASIECQVIDNYTKLPNKTFCSFCTRVSSFFSIKIGSYYR